MTGGCAMNGRGRLGPAALVAALMCAAGPAPAQSDPAQSDPAQSDPAQSDPAQSDPAQSDPGFATLEPVGQGARAGFAAGFALRDDVTGEAGPVLRLDLFGRAPLTMDAGLHARLAAAYGSGKRLGPSIGGSGAVGLDRADRLALYGAHLGGHWVARWSSMLAPLAVSVVLPIREPDGFEQSVRGAAIWARLGDYPAGRSGFSLRVSASPTLRFRRVVARLELGGDLPLTDLDDVGFEVGLRAGLAVAAPVGPLVVMVEGLSYSLFTDYVPFRSYTLAFGLRYVDAWLRPSVHAVVPVGESVAPEPVWWVVGVDWVMDGAGVSSGRPAAAR